MTPTDTLRAARDHLLHLRGHQSKAREEFAFPDVGAHFNFAHDWFDTFARGNETPGLIIASDTTPDEIYSFGELSARSDQVATWLRHCGVGVGDAVLVMLDNDVHLWDCMLALTKVGAVIMPTTTACGPKELTERVSRGQARAVICNARDAAQFDTVPGDYLRLSIDEPDHAEGDWHNLRDAFDVMVDPLPHPQNASGDPLLLYFTSGTTKKPKLVEHTHVSYPVGHLSTMYWLGLAPGDLHLNVSSPGWAKHAWSSFFAPWLAESTALVYRYARFDAQSLLRVVHGHDVTSMCAPPTVWRMLINADLAGGPGRLRELISAGEPLNPEVIASVEEAWGLTIRDGFGQTETTAQIGNSPGEAIKPGSMGRPLPGVPSVLVDPDTDRLITGAGEGELCLDLRDRHPLPLMPGYRGDASINARVMAGGFYRTGDLAVRDEDGYITYLGRDDDVFKASDYKISPFELESVLIEHPAVAEAAVVPAPDDVRLAVPKAYVALVSGYPADAGTAASIFRHARTHLPPYERVRRLEFFTLPKTISGKIRRVELRQREVDLRGNMPEEFCDSDFPNLTKPE